MYIWVGINVDRQILSLKEKVRATENKLGFQNSNFTLPFHISLKISFLIDDCDFDHIIEDIRNIYKSTAPFEIEVKGIEWENNIAWIRMKENSDLTSLSQRINQMLLEKYRIPLHEYDLDFKFHTTLFMDDDREKVRIAFDEVKACPLPDKLIVNRLLIGGSPAGKLGTFNIIEETII